MPRITNVTYGRVLFQDKSTSGTPFFHDNVPEVTKKLADLTLLDKHAKLFGTAGGIRNYFQTSLEVKLIPDGFSKFENFENLPNIEIWFNVNNSVVDLKSCTIYVNEGEKNVFVPVPECKFDMKFQSSYNSVLISGDEPEFNVTFIKKQKSLFEFVNKIPVRLLRLSDSDSIARLTNAMENHNIDININGRKKNVPYLITSVRTKKTIELEFDGQRRRS
ncbi:unnamed protein product [Ambrosiozyma monospora]|uniref:Unnamed protein product n=1 Tax=Ambrosiozyma monospora TaxID=43982 RepID=A0ACB5TQ49_AMBMO|nr:unnamed protein product [Ambrosiozyma monospora]